MLNARGFKATLFFLTIALMLGFQSHHLSNAEHDEDVVGNTSCSAVATGWDNGPAWIAWAGFSASFSKKGKKAGDSVDGSYDLYAYMPPPGPAIRNKADFTLTIKKALGFLWLMDDSAMGNISQVGGSPTNHAGRSTAKAKCGSAATKKCTWP